MKKFKCVKVLLVSFTFCILHSASANTITVSSITELQSAIAKAKPGDKIVVKDGTYTTTSDINISCVGTKEHPITITAQNFGKAEITGTGGFNLVSPSAYVIIRDFKFTHAASRAKSSSGSTFCRWTNNIFETPGDGEDLLIAGNDNEIDHNTFQNKNAMGRFLAIRGTGSQIAERLWIHHNYFKSQKDQGGKNGAETLQFGLSGFSLSSSNSVVEYNLFEDCAGENEMISVKASAVTLRYNTIRNCPAQFTLRHGNKCQVYGNYFYNTPGLRIFGDDHLIYSNYFEHCDPAITIGNGDGEVADGAKLTSHDRPDRILIALNILVNNKTNIVMQGRKNGLGATKVKIASNVIQGGNSAAAISGPYTDAVWEKNTIFNTVAGDMPEGTYAVKDPNLVMDKSGVFRLPVNASYMLDGQQKIEYVKTNALYPDEVGASTVR
ncbi:MAG TPA: polysaccharide lyase 6 family protein [Flavisolibacter sp.]|jgi:poly(beta-D-mannuronate) lyase|nr:polysaccharide lyase 6 family protein [Flavisolibacter sp.]